MQRQELHCKADNNHRNVEGLPRAIGLCEAHFQAANKPTGAVTYDFEFDSFDAFADTQNEAACLVS